MVKVTELISLEIQNLFSYYSPNAPTRFELTRGKESNNVMIIQGRNGYGKTSFINALRLLFLGSAGEEAIRAIMRLGQNTVVPAFQEFMLGIPGRWEGVINKRACTEMRRPIKASVRLEWQEQAGTTWAKRSWIVRNQEVTERLEVCLPSGSVLEDVSAQTVLEERLPARFVRFYIFDGEEMQSIASALSSASGKDGNTNEDKKSNGVSQMLGVDRLDSLIDTLASIKKNLGKSAREKAMQTKADEAEATYNRAQLAEMNANSESVRLMELCETLTMKRKQVEDKIMAASSSLNVKRELQSLHEKIAASEKRLQQRSDEFEQHLARIPLLANPTLVNETVEKLKAHHQNSQTVDLLRQIIEEVPNELFSKGFRSKFNPETVEKIQERLRDILADYLNDGIGDRQQVFQSLGDEQRLQILHVLNEFGGLTQEDARLRTELLTWEKDIAQSEQDVAELRRLKSQHVSASSLELLNKEKDAILIQLSNAERDRSELSKKLPGLRQYTSACKAEWTRAQDALDVSQKILKRGPVAEQWLDFLKAYRTEYQRRQFSELGTKMCQHWFTLVNEKHRQFARIRFEEDLTIRLLNERGVVIGLGSFSEGMKQLLATSFLWALMDCTERRFPIVIDTPLGRIDYGHQQTMLTKFYPMLGTQVIILPTDSELNATNLGVLQPYIYKKVMLDYDLTKGTQIS